MAIGESKGIGRALESASNALSKVFKQLASGKRINSASDDPAGLAIAKGLEAAVATLGQAQRNIADSTSSVEIADAALGSVSDITSRLSELAAQASNGTLSDQQRGALNIEYQQLSQEIQRIGATTEFNGTNLLTGDAFTSQVGIDSTANSQISIAGTNLASLAQSVTSQDITTQAGAQTALDQANAFIGTLAQARGQFGAVESRLERAYDNAGSAREKIAGAQSRIEDADIAQSAADKVANDIRQQTTTAIFAQANQTAKTVLQLLS